ncbi:MAG: hypothetical protein WCI51_23200 [Lentisphaerota bacterium]
MKMMFAAKLSLFLSAAGVISSAACMASASGWQFNSGALAFMAWWSLPPVTIAYLALFYRYSLMQSYMVSVTGGLCLTMGFVCCLLVLIHPGARQGAVFLFTPLLQLAVIALINVLLGWVCPLGPVRPRPGGRYGEDGCDSDLTLRLRPLEEKHEADGFFKQDKFR